ncbi:MAG: Non-canonical purine NTP pyrophosphatase [Chlamydiae bacterium]|nr:Non-canonical purine NTP pyrophosphatase [Chlamydiota bacterium]
MEIVLASRNLGKIREFRKMLSEVIGLDVDSLLSFPDYPSPEETGTTFEENATLKATSAAKALNKIVLADDSGLVVPSLDGEPGVHSARYAGEDATDHENTQKLLEALKDKSDLERQAYYECALVLAGPEGEVLKISKGHCEGIIAEEARGRHGFGFDPVFIKHDYDKTFSELSDDIKNRISHRRKALDSVKAYLEGMMSRATST